MCGEKVPKQQWLNRDGTPHPEMFQMQASAFIDFWMKSMRIHNPVAREEDMLAAFKQSIVQKEQQLRLKRGHRAMDEAFLTQTTIPEDSPSPSKRRATESRGMLHTKEEHSTMVTHIYAPNNTPEGDFIGSGPESILSSGPSTISIEAVTGSPVATVNSSSQERDQFIAEDGTIIWDKVLYLDDNFFGRYYSDDDS